LSKGKSATKRPPAMMARDVTSKKRPLSAAARKAIPYNKTRRGKARKAARPSRIPRRMKKTRFRVRTLSEASRMASRESRRPEAPISSIHPGSRDDLESALMELQGPNYVGDMAIMVFRHLYKTLVTEFISQPSLIRK
jgi:hypothetical protein